MTSVCKQSAQKRSRKKCTGNLGAMRDGELCGSYRSPNIVGALKPEGIQWAAHVAQMKEADF